MKILKCVQMCELDKLGKLAVGKLAVGFYLGSL